MPSDNDRLPEFLERAKKFLENGDRLALWQAYVAVEHAILDLKLRHGLEIQPAKKVKKASDSLPAITTLIGKIDPTSKDKKKILEDLRQCRDLLKSIVAKM